MSRVVKQAVALLANVFLAFVLAFGCIPCMVSGSVDIAWATEGEDYDDEQARIDEEERQRQEEEERQAAEEAARKAQEDQAQADAVIALIDALPAATSAVGSDLTAADAAVVAYESLTPDQQALVPSDRVNKVYAVAAAAAAAWEAEQQQQDPGGNPPGDDPPGGEGGDPSEPEEPVIDTYYVMALLLKWDKPDNQGYTHFVGDSSVVEKAYRTISITEFGETVQLNGYYLSTDGTGNAYQTADSSTSIGSFDLDWRSSDESIATVTPSGLVKPQGKNGAVTITAIVADPMVYQGEPPMATVTIVFDGQDGKYVKNVEILDESGNSIGEAWGGVTVYDEENAFHQLQARVTWYNVADGSETVQVTGAGEDYDARNVDTTIVWNVSSSNAFSINPDTGRLRCGAYSGNAFVTCTAVGGLGGKDVVDTANVQLDTGVYEYNPADSLSLKVVWEERPDVVVKEATYSYSELLGMLGSYHVNATVVSGTRFGVISADGFLFKDVVSLVAVDDADVLQYRFSTADGYDNPVSYQYLFESGNRYYFPNYELGGSRAEGQIVPPILAYQSSFQWNVSEANPNVALDEGTRFRLVFGCLASGDANTSFQIYYINGITVVLKGGPSAGGQGGSGAGNNGETDGQGGTNGDGSGGSGGGKTGSSNQGGTGTGGGNTKGNLSGANGDGQKAAGAEQAAGTSGNDVAADEAKEQASNAESAAAGGDVGSAKRWRVYQMMNKTNSDVPDWDDENPISPFALPAVLGTMALGFGSTGIGFRRRLK